MPFSVDEAMKRYEEGEEELEEHVTRDPREVTGQEKVLLDKKSRKTKSKSGKHKAKTKKNKGNKAASTQAAAVANSPATAFPDIKIEQPTNSKTCYTQRDYTRLTPAERVDLENEPPAISELEMELAQFPGYQEKLHALLVTGDLSGFITQRPPDMRVVYARYPELEIKDNSTVPELQIVDDSTRPDMDLPDNSDLDIKADLELLDKANDAEILSLYNQIVRLQVDDSNGNEFDYLSDSSSSPDSCTSTPQSGFTPQTRSYFDTYSSESEECDVEAARKGALFLEKCLNLYDDESLSIDQ